MLGVTSVKLSISLPRELLERVDQLLARPGEGRSTMIARLLSQTLREAEEAEMDAAYDRALQAKPVTQADLDRTDALARAAIRSTRRSSR
jgi:Arc/MetJ-type ribon-helix-helix transcriptional regulator